MYCVVTGVLSRMLSSHRISNAVCHSTALPDLRGDWLVRWYWVNFQCQSVLLIWIIVEQGPAVLAVGAGGGCLDIFFLSPIISLFFLRLSRIRPDID